MRWVNDEHLAVLGKCHILNLEWCCDITNNGMKHIRNVHTVLLNGTNISDDGIKELKNCHTLDLHGKSRTATNMSIKELGNCHTLNLKWSEINDETLKELQNCHTLDLTLCRNLTDEGFSALKCHVLHVGCTNISGYMINLLRSRGCIVHVTY